MEKNEREKQMLFEWGKENRSKYSFQLIDKTMESYFIQRQGDTYIREYGFETLPELMKELDILWNNDEIMKQTRKIVGVAAIKNKPIKRSDENEQEKKFEESKETLPDFIYSF